MSASSSRRVREEESRSDGQRSTAMSQLRFIRLVLLFVLFVVGLWFVEACDFTPRTPQPPETDEGRLVNLSDPDSVLFQIKVGFEDGIITSYMNALTEDFRFFPDEQDSIALSVEKPGVFDEWTRDVEQGVIGLVFQTSTTRGFSSATAESTVLGVDVVVLDEDYEFIVDTNTYAGRAELQMRLASGAWRIFRWIDRRSPASGFPSSSVLRAENSLGARSVGVEPGNGN